ncbi:MAG: hypothetical protein BWY87_01342 [Deltaproteobacteria bacterium ADurb.Bin510]|nr:MAG: hypothetical protein BWY87_01342 [Deltaproteobacteria bacterium ADurb.Bin510]
MKRILTTLALGLALTACNIHNPYTTVRTVDERPGIVLSGAPAEARLFVDGLDMGAARTYAERALRLEPGSHLIEIRQGGVALFSQRVFIESGLKEIKVR